MTKPLTELRSLGYLGVASTDPAAWDAFATELLGMQRAGRSADGAAFRLDDYRQRLFVEPGLPEGGHVVGWEVDDAAALDALARRLERAGVHVQPGDPALAARRCVAQVLSFEDPAGRTLEAFHTPQRAVDPFVPARPLSGFRTAELGLGHVVFTVSDLKSAREFYEGLLGFRLSDFMQQPFGACFLHLNPRHHSLALIETGQDGLHHLMVELNSLDDVGQAYDLVCDDRERLGVSLGRHTNDFMTSFYVRSPSGFMIEYGWGGLEIDPDDWQPRELHDGPSLWGHERYWLGDEARARARAMRLEAARRGRGAPVQVAPGHYRIKPSGWRGRREP